MLQVETTKTTERARFVFVPAIMRSGEWLARRCGCGRVGWVAIYPGREEESFKYIASPAWECGHCQKETDEATLAFESKLAEGE